MENMCFVKNSITLNAKELEEAKQLAEENGVVLAEAMTIYHMPLYKKLAGSDSKRKVRETLHGSDEFWKL